MALEAPELTAGSARSMSTGEVFRAGGVVLLVTLFALNFFDDVGIAAIGVLGPDIQHSLGLSDTAITVLGALGGALVLVGCVPAAVLADRYARTKVIAATSILLGAFTALTGAAQTAWQLVVARLGAGVNKGNLPAFNSVIADAIPIEGRARGFAFYNGSNAVAYMLTPVVIGGIASFAGGDDGWRWAFLLTSVPVVALGVLAWFLRDPERGQHERAAVLGDADTTLVDEPPPPIDEAWARLKRIRTFYYLTIGLSVVGIGLFVVPTMTGLYLERRFDLGAGDRGAIASLAAIGSLVGTLLTGAFGDRLNQRDPADVLRGIGLLILGTLFTVVAFLMPTLPLFTIFLGLGNVPLSAVFVALTVVATPIIPPRLRSMGFALTTLYMAVGGGLGGSIISGALSDAYGERTAVAVVLLATVPVSTALLFHAARFVHGDIAAVERDLIDEDEQRKLRAARPDGPLPGEALLEVRRLDFSYGPLQVLFEVELDLVQGEVLALLGTNGAGKSTLLRAITGLGFPDRGVVRFAGDDITYTEPAGRVRRGIVQVPGGKAIFPNLTVEENLRLGGFTLSSAQYEERRASSLDLFPALQPRLDQPAGTMSGGERQMLALAKGLLLDPRLLCIDELSLGLAPIVVEQLIEVVAQLKARGVTMLIVEQSVNVALTLADRAVFMEKGHVRFEGPAADLLERDDLVRAVFLGGEGG